MLCECGFCVSGESSRVVGEGRSGAGGHGRGEGEIKGISEWTKGWIVRVRGSVWGRAMPGRDRGQGHGREKEGDIKQE